MYVFLLTHILTHMEPYMLILSPSKAAQIIMSPQKCNDLADMAAQAPLNVVVPALRTCPVLNVWHSLGVQHRQSANESWRLGCLSRLEHNIVKFVTC